MWGNAIALMLLRLHISRSKEKQMNVHPKSVQWKWDSSSSKDITELTGPKLHSQPQELKQHKHLAEN